MNAIIPTANAEVYKASTDAATLCKEIVVETAMTIQGRKYVKVEGWQAIALAHGCTGSARDVERVEGGIRAIGEIRRMTDGAVIAEAEGFVGEDEPTWYGGEVNSYGKTKILPKRPDYAIRAMAQTRAISRACRSAFAHVVVMMNAGLSTTPAEEVPMGGFDDDHRAEAAHNVTQTAKPASRKSGQTVLETFITDMKKHKTIEAVDAWASQQANEIMEKLSRKEQDDMQAAYEDWRNECGARVEPKDAGTPFDDAVPFGDAA